MKKLKNFRKCVIFGKIKQPNPYYLPRKIDVIWLLLTQERNKKSKDPENQDKIFSAVAVKILDLWKKTSFPHLSNLAVKKKVKDLFQEYERISNTGNSEMVSNYKVESSNLFDVCNCKCTCTQSKCSCTCGMNKKACSVYIDKQVLSSRPISCK